MFWSFLLPIFLTFLITPCSYYMLKKYGFKKSGILAFFAFIPTCTGVSIAVNMYTFGVHNYQKADDIGFPMVAGNIPDKSKNIELHFYNGYFAAKFEISEADLSEWFHKVWRESGERAAFEMEKPTAVDSKLPSYLVEHGWNVTDGYIKYEGPIYGNGSGSQLFFDKQNNVAYQFYAFW